MNKEVLNKLYVFFNGFIVCLFTFLSAVIVYFSYRFYIHMNMEDGSYILRRQSFSIFVMSFLFFCLLLGLKKILRKINPSILFWIGGGTYVLVGLLLVFFTSPIINDDPAMVFGYIKNFLSGDFHGITKGYYFSYAPGNLGLLTYEIPFYFVSQNVRFFFALNLLWVMISEYSVWKISELLYKESWLIQNYVIILEFGFVPMLFHIMRIYGQTPGAAFFSYAVLIGMRMYYAEGWTKKKIVASVCSMVLLIGMACMVRANYMIAAIALLMTCLLLFMKRRRVGILLLGIICFIGSIAIPAENRNAYKILGKENFDTGVPYSCYVYMGSSPNNFNRLLDGWFDGYNWDTYAACEFDTIRADEVGKNDLRKLVNQYMSNKELMWEVFRHKMITTWSEPTFQSVLNGPAEYTNGLTNKTAILSSLYSGDYAYLAYELLMRIIMLVFYSIWFVGGIIYFVRICKMKVNGVEDGFTFFMLHFIGTYIFHVFWETNASYVFVSVFWMILFVAWSLKKIADSSEIFWHTCIRKCRLYILKLKK